MKKISTKKLVLTALFMSLIIVSTMFIRVPLPLGYVNLGDAFIFLSVFILGPVLGCVAAGVGSAIADILGYIVYAPGTLIIKTLMAIVVYFVYKAVLKASNKFILAEIVGGIAGAVVMSMGYFFYEILFFETALVAAVNIPYNLLQGVVGIVIAVAVMRILIASKILEKMQK